MDKLSTLPGLGALSPLDLATQQQSTNKANQLKAKDLRSEAQLEKASGGFEALLLHQMLKSMWSTVQTTGLLGEDSNQAQIYQDMLNQAVADSVAEGRGIGVKDFLRNQLRKYSSDAS